MGQQDQQQEIESSRYSRAIKANIRQSKLIKFFFVIMSGSTSELPIMPGNLDATLEERKMEFQIACDDGSSEACHSLAEYFNLIDHEEQKALDLFRRNCDPPKESSQRRFPASCFGGATMIFQNPAIKDKSEGIDMLNKGCVGGFPEACHNMAVIYRGGMYKVEKNPAKAESCYDTACSKGHAKSCFGKAALLMNRNEKQEALLFFEKACLHGDPYGCSNAHVMLRTGDGVNVDNERAALLKTRAIQLAKELGINTKE